MKFYYITVALLLITSSWASEEGNYDPFQSEPKPTTEEVGKISDFPEWTFCVAYNFRDADKRDARPSPFKSGDSKSSEYKDGSEDTYIHNGSLLLPKYMFDTAGLLSRVTSQKMINKVSAQRIFDLTLKDNKRQYLTYDCYDPHHIIIFYQDYGIPVGCIEICFTCNRARISCRKKGTESTIRIYPASHPDFFAIATIIHESGLSLSPYKSLVEYKEKLDEQAKKVEQYLKD